MLVVFNMIYKLKGKTKPNIFLQQAGVLEGLTGFLLEITPTAYLHCSLQPHLKQTAIRSFKITTQMSIFELIGELFNPGQVGEIDFNDRRETYHRKFIIIRLVISLLLLGLLEYLFLRHPKHYNDFVYILKVNAFLLIYLLISFKIKIRSNSDNLGWVPFLIDNPFRISDDFNRFLVVLKVLFMPGKYISSSIHDFYISIVTK